MLKNTFASRDVELWTSLYKTYHLEFAVSAWNPYLKKDKLALEKVQRRATRMPTSIKDFDYETRKDVMGLTSSRNQTTTRRFNSIFQNNKRTRLYKLAFTSDLVGTESRKTCSIKTRNNHYIESPQLPHE